MDLLLSPVYPKLWWKQQLLYAFKGLIVNSRASNLTRAAGNHSNKNIIGAYKKKPSVCTD